MDWYNTLYCTYDPATFEQLPELFFNIDGVDYKVPRESLYVPLDEYDDLMAVEITYIDGWDEWLFGLTFLENYYTVYDMEQQRLGFAMSKSSTMAPKNLAENATASLLAQDSIQAVSEGSDGMMMGLNFTACAALPVLALGLMYKACKSSK